MLICITFYVASADSKQVYSEIYYLQQGANVSLSAEAIYT